MTLGKRVKMIRESVGKTQKEMAELVDVGLRTWQQYEEGVHDPSWKVVVHLTKLGFSADWLATGEGLIKTGEAAYGLAEEVKNGDITGERAETFEPKEKRADRSPIKAAAVSYIDRMTDAAVAEVIKYLVPQQKPEPEELSTDDKRLQSLTPEEKEELRAIIEEQIRQEREKLSPSDQVELKPTGT